MKVVWLCCISWLMSPAGVEVVTAVHPATGGESFKGSWTWSCLYCFHEWLTMIKEVKYTLLLRFSAILPPHYTPSVITTELASYHFNISPFHQLLSVEKTDSSYIKPAMKKNGIVYGHSFYLHILKSQFHTNAEAIKIKNTLSQEF